MSACQLSRVYLSSQRCERKEDWHMQIFSQRDRMKPNIAFYVQPFICRITTCGKSKWFSPQVPKLKAGKEGDLGPRSSLSLERRTPESRALCRSPAQQLWIQFQLAPCNRVRYEWDNACGSKFKIILCTWHFYMLPYIYTYHMHISCEQTGYVFMAI